MVECVDRIISTLGVESRLLYSLMFQLDFIEKSNMILPNSKNIRCIVVNSGITGGLLTRESWDNWLSAIQSSVMLLFFAGFSSPMHKNIMLGAK